ncbi:hypothetical protein GOP47_0029564 [Adiantum capillus-veneris]|nr:hypothetical protein GOP47_0029564 [Adiantum capillus-veneris]
MTRVLVCEACSTCEGSLMKVTSLITMALSQISGRIALSNLVTILVVMGVLAMAGQSAMAQVEPPTPTPTTGDDNAATLTPVAFLATAFASLLVGVFLSY